MPKVSIATISFNQAAFLERAICSVLDQNYSDIEYIVIDPGSTDGSRDIIERYKTRISRVIYESDQGPADGLNKCFAYASGDIFGYINADDAYLPGAISEAVAALESTSADVIYGDGYFVDENDRCIRRSISTPFSFRRFASGGAVILQQSTFFRANAYRDLGGFNIANRTSWDYELLFDFAASGKNFLHISRYWSVFRLHSSSITGSGRLLQEYYRDRERIVEKLTFRYTWTFRVSKAAARLEKHLVSPRSTLFRLLDSIRLPRIKLARPNPR